MSKRLLFGTLLVSLLAPLAARAEALCVLHQLESVESTKVRETLIVAKDLEVNSNKERWFVSNDGSVKLQIKRAVAAASRGELLVHVLVNDVVSLRSIAQSYGNFVGVQAAFAAPDGRAFNLSCVAQPTR